MKSSLIPSTLRGGLVWLPALVLAGCMSNPLVDSGRQAISEGRPEDGLKQLEQALKEDPKDSKLRALVARERLQTSSRLTIQGEQERIEGKFDAAEKTFKRALVVNPGFDRAEQGLEQIRVDLRHRQMLRDADAALKKRDPDKAETLARTVIAQEPGNREARRLLDSIDQGRVAAEQATAKSQAAVKNKPLTLEFRDAALKTVFEVLSRSAGVNFVFDKDVKADTKVTIFVRNTPMEEVIRLILATNQLERRQLNDNSYLIFPNNAGKLKEYQELSVRTFYLSNADGKQVMNLLKTVLKMKDVHVDEKLNIVIVRDTAQAIQLAEKLVQGIDVAEPEVMLDVEVLEINRSRLSELGIRFPDQIGYGKITPDVINSVLDTSGNTISKSTTFGGALATGYVDTRRNTGSLTTYVANPVATLNLRNEKGDSNLLANPRIRVRNREKAKIHIGDKLPVFTTTSTANVGVSASVSYLDVGLKLEVEPQIYLDDDVAIKVGLEVSSVTKEVSGPEKSLAYQVGTRTTNTILRLKNGETQILAGLISDEERSAANRLPGLGDLPIIGRLFGSQSDTANKTEIILLITPRVVRNIAPPDWARASQPAGTESMVGAPSLTVKNNGERSLGMSSQGGAGTSGQRATSAPAPAPVETAVEEKPEAAREAPAAAGAPAAAPNPPATPAPAPGGPPPVASTSASAPTVNTDAAAAPPPRDAERR